MKTMSKLLSILAICFGVDLALAGTHDSGIQSTSAPISDVTFNSTGEKLKAKVMYFNGCYKPWLEMKGVENNKIFITHMAKINSQVCTQAVQFNWVNFDLSDLPSGKYAVIDAYDGSQLGWVEL